MWHPIPFSPNPRITGRYRYLREHIRIHRAVNRIATLKVVDATEIYTDGEIQAHTSTRCRRARKQPCNPVSQRLNYALVRNRTSNRTSNQDSYILVGEARKLRKKALYPERGSACQAQCTPDVPASLLLLLFNPTTTGMAKHVQRFAPFSGGGFGRACKSFLLKI